MFRMSAEFKHLILRAVVLLLTIMLFNMYVSYALDLSSLSNNDKLSPALRIGKQAETATIGQDAVDLMQDSGVPDLRGGVGGGGDYLEIITVSSILETAKIGLENAQRNGYPLGIIVFDMDKFSRFTPADPLEEGDYGPINAILQEGLSGIDCTVVRTEGADDYLILIPRIASLDDAVDIAENLRAAIERDLDATINITASFGVSFYDGVSQGNNLAVFHQALKALETAKSLGRNRVVVYDESIQEK